MKEASEVIRVRNLTLMRRLICSVLWGSFSLSGYGADFFEVYQSALQNDATLAVARHGLEATQERVPQALAGNLPAVNLTANRNFTDARASFNNAKPTNQGVFAWGWNLQMTMPLVRPQNVIASLESGALVDAAEFEYAGAYQDLVLRIAQAYFDALVAQETAKAAEAQMLAMQEQQVVARRGYELGTMSIIDSQDAKSKAEQARAQFLNAQNEIENRLAVLERYTGKAVADLAELNPISILPNPDPMDRRNWIEKAKDENLAVQSLQASLQSAGYTLSKSRASNMWTLDFVVSTSTNYSSGSVSVPNGFESRVNSKVAGFQFAMPIFEGGMNSSKIRESLANRDKLAAQLEETRRKAGADARQAYADVLNGLTQIEALQSAVESGESAVKGNQAGYKRGVRINSDVLNAQQQLFFAKRDLVKARYDTLLAGLKLKASVGDLTEADVMGINQLLMR